MTTEEQKAEDLLSRLGALRVSPLELRILLLCAFRYSLGRMSYMPMEVQDLIRKYSSVLRSDDFEMLAKEIRQARNLGMEIDKKGWFEFAEWCDQQC